MINNKFHNNYDAPDFNVIPIAPDGGIMCDGRIKYAMQGRNVCVILNQNHPLAFLGSRVENFDRFIESEPAFGYNGNMSTEEFFACKNESMKQSIIDAHNKQKKVNCAWAHKMFPCLEDCWIISWSYCSPADKWHPTHTEGKISTFDSVLAEVWAVVKYVSQF